MFKNILSIIKHIPKSLIVVAIIILIISAKVLFTGTEKEVVEESKPVEETNTILETVSTQKITTKHDLILPKPTDEAVSDFEKYHILKLDNVTVSDNTLSLDIINTSPATVKLLSLTIFEKDSSEFEEVYLGDIKLKSNEKYHLDYDLIKVKNPEIQTYSYFYKLNDILVPTQVDLKNKAAYGEYKEEEDLF